MNYSNLTNAEKRNLLLTSERCFFTIANTKLNNEYIFEFCNGNEKGRTGTHSIVQYIAHRLDKTEYSFNIKSMSMNVKVLGENVIDCYTFDFLDRRLSTRIKLDDITIKEVVNRGDF